MTNSSLPASPTISIVIASKVGESFIDRCLVSIKAEADKYGAETIIVTPENAPDAERIGREYPWVKLVAAPGVHEVPALTGARR